MSERWKTISDLRDTHKMNKYQHFVIYVWASENLHWIIHTYWIFLRALQYHSLLRYYKGTMNKVTLTFHVFIRSKNLYNGCARSVFDDSGQWLCGETVCIIYLNQSRSNDVFLGITKTLQTKLFGHEKFTGYVRLRFVFLLGRLI